MPTSEERLLQRIRKSLEQHSDTAYNLEPWQEGLTRNTNVPAVKALTASEVISGLAGSWASAYQYGHGVLQTSLAGALDQSARSSEAAVPVPVRNISSRLGLPGLPEINFVPYSWRTNRFGSKGPSLLGHPISFTVVGPTLKSPFCDWQWTVTDNSGVPGVGDTLAMAVGPLGAITAANLADGYNLTGTIADYLGGLYVVITDNGTTSGSLAAGSNGLTPLAAHTESARFEIFRVESFAGSTLTLDPSKRLAEYFTIPGVNPAIRAVMVIQPYTTRLAAVPGSGSAVGRERTFVVISPETAANSDIFPPYDGGVPGDGSWLQGGFEASGTAGEAGAYGGAIRLPVPVPIRDMTGTVEDVVAPTDDAGYWRITNLAGGVDAVNDIGRIIHIFTVNRLETATPDTGTVEAMLGWFEIVSVPGGTAYQLKRVPEVDPTTGQVYFGPGPSFDSTGLPGAPDITVAFTVHEAVDSIWSGGYDTDRVNAVRLTNLIDPTWVERSTKRDEGASLPTGSTPSRADRAIFDTSLSASGQANPGSLLDLGFRMVLFPAKTDGGGNAIPDFDNPIDSREVVIDSSITDESQYIDIDYSAGTVTLSHAPPAIADGQIVPNGIVGVGGNNPRGEVVLFAACVPYSMEEGQTGVGIRITGGDLLSADLGYADAVQADVSSAFVITAVSAVGAAPTDDITIVSADGFPPTGKIEIVSGAGTPYGTSQGTFGYTSIDTSGASPVLQGVYTTAGAVPTLPATAIIRRGDGDYRLDTTYGSKWRVPALRLAYADLTPNLDGSITVMPTAVAGPAEELRAFFPLGTSSEIARLFLDSNTQRWTTSAPPYNVADINEIGVEVTRGRVIASMNLDLGAGSISYARHLNRVIAVDRVASTPSTHFTLTVDPDPGTSGTAGVAEILPMDDPSGLCAVIEGSSIASAEQGSWTGALVAGQRLLINVKEFSRRNGGATDEDIWRSDEGPANPINWYAFTAVGGDTLANIAADINTFYSTVSQSDRQTSPVEVNGNRLLFTERQVSILPAQHYLKSADVAGFSIPANAVLALTIFSADASTTNAGKWITITLRFGALASNDPIVIAATLNDVIYNSLNANYVGDALDRAGFFATSVATVNPGLLAAGYNERQILFIGPDDPRHPDGSNTVCLLCGGWGSASQNGAQDFFNVMATVGRSEGAIANSDVTVALGGDFFPVAYNPPKCGLFFGTDAKSAGAAPVAADFANETVRGSAATNMRFATSGVSPLGILVGAHAIDSVNTGGPNPLVTIRLPSGSESPI